MAGEAPPSVKLRSVPLVILAVIYVGWAAAFIARSSFETSGGRYFCLFDDAMVNLRYAWNLAHGNGLVWNPGERVEGSTSFLSTITMALGALFLDKSTAALVVQITGIPLVLSVALMARQLGRSLDGTKHLELLTAAAVLAYYPLSYWPLMGMETGFLTALAMSALLVAVRHGSHPQGSKLLGLLLGLMFATRPDAIVPAAMILAFRAAWILLRHRRLGALKRWLVEVAVFAGIVAGLTLFRSVYYRSPVPNTYYLKLADWPLHLRLRNGWKFVVPFLETSRYLLLLALCSVVFHRDRRRLLLLSFAGCVIAVQIWVGGDAWRYWRMLVPAVVVLIVLAVDGGSTLVRWAVRPERRRLLVGLGLACPAWAVWAANERFTRELLMEVPAYTVRFNETSVQAGVTLSHCADPQGSVAVAAAGAVPYYSGLRGVDVLGRSDPYIARLRVAYDERTVTPGHQKVDLHYSIEKLRPDAIYDAVTWGRYDHGFVAYVMRNYVQRGSFWWRRDSPYVRWDRLPPR